MKFNCIGMAHHGNLHSTMFYVGINFVLLTYNCVAYLIHTILLENVPSS